MNTDKLGENAEERLLNKIYLISAFDYQTNYKKIQFILAVIRMKVGETA